MKKNFCLFVLMLVTMFIFSACTQKTAETPENNPLPEVETAKPENENKTSKENLSKNTPFTYKIPENWSEFPEMTTDSETLKFYAPSDAHVENETSNVIVEVLKKLDSETGNMDYYDKETQESFLEFQKQVLTSKWSNVENITFETMEYNMGITYIVSFTLPRENDTIKQTQYYPMGAGYSLIIYATDFSDNILPDVNEVAKDIVNSLETKEDM